MGVQATWSPIPPLLPTQISSYCSGSPALVCLQIPWEADMNTEAPSSWMQRACVWPGYVVETKLPREV